MTGFGTGAHEGPAGAVSVELRSFNHRSLKVTLRVPPALQGFEPDLEGRVRESLSRGAVSGTFRLSRPGGPAGPLVDEVLARRYAEALADLASRLGLPGQPDLPLVASLPGVVAPAAEAEGLDEDLRRSAEAALDAALRDLAASRAREGAALRKDFERRLRAVERSLGLVAKRAPKAAAAARDRWRRRLDEVLEGHPEEALRDAAAREAALQAERADVAEEVTRLRHHLAAFRASAGGDGEAGRRLDFLLQEMLREVNTIGSKCQDAAIAAAVVDMKVEVDRMKEQAANVE
jgi:uncharacterized protein (TIGR00255 family)